MMSHSFDKPENLKTFSYKRLGNRNVFKLCCQSPLTCCHINSETFLHVNCKLKYFFILSVISQIITNMISGVLWASAFICCGLSSILCIYWIIYAVIPKLNVVIPVCTYPPCRAATVNSQCVQRNIWTIKSTGFQNSHLHSPMVTGTFLGEKSGFLGGNFNLLKVKFKN